MEDDGDININKLDATEAAEVCDLAIYKIKK